MTTASTRTPALARRWPMPWDNATPAPMLSPQLLHKPHVLEMHMRYTTGISISQHSTIDTARSGASALTPAEVAHIMTNPRQAADALAAKRSTRLQWACLCTALNVSRAIEDGGVVRGLAAYLPRRSVPTTKRGNHMIKPRTFFAKLMDEAGAEIAEPTSVIGSVSFDGKTGDAYAWAADGKTILAEMKCARVVWIEAVGIRLEGHEPVGSDRFRLMQWQVIF